MSKLDEARKEFHEWMASAHGRSSDDEWYYRARESTHSVVDAIVDAAEERILAKLRPHAAGPAPTVDAAEVIERLDEIVAAMLFGGVRDEHYRPTTEAMIDNITRAYVLIDNLKGKCVDICRRAILAEPDCGFTVVRTPAKEGGTP